MQRNKTLFQVLALLGVLVLFFVSLELMGDSFKLMGRGFAETLLRTTSNPFVGLFIGILATSLVQSSSTTTALTVGMVAGGGLTVAGAIPIMMGANIGTSVTNTIVSLGHITRKDEFRRAMAGATVHDFFNLLTVAIALPLELTTGEKIKLPAQEGSRLIIIVAHGEVQLMEDDRQLSLLKKGDVWGDLFQHGPALNANHVMARERTILFRINLLDFYYVMANHHELVQGLIKNITEQKEAYTLPN